MVSAKSLAAAALLAQFDVAHAFWRQQCSTITTGRIDPIISPGRVSGHTHSIVGGMNIDVNSTYESLRNSQCTSCEVTADKSGYWTPTLYYNYPNGSFIEVPHGGSLVYYLGRGPNVASVVPFPKGIRFLSGDYTARSYDNTTMTWGNSTYPGRPVADRVTFNCLDEEPIPQQNYMFRTNCSNGLRAQITFQSCWDGVNLYFQNQSHVAYLSQIDNGVCPPTHPVQLPLIFMETLWGTANVPDQQEGGQFVFAMGDPTGYGFHGDFQNGWDIDVLANASANCLAGASDLGLISNCPVLEAVDTSGYPHNCPARDPGIDEQYKGLLSKLPGCNEITYGPGPAPSSSNNCPSTVEPPAISYINTYPLQTNVPVPGQSYGLSSEQIYINCYNDSAAGVRTLNAASLSTQQANVTFCQNWCNSQGYRLTGLEYGQECHCDNAINPTAIAGSNQCNWDCAGSQALVSGPDSTIDVCGGLGYVSVYNNTDPSFNADGNMQNSAGGVSKPSALVSPGPNYLGCATDNQGSTRALSGPSSSAVNMTNAMCASFCQSASPGGYKYYATEYAQQCFCGNTLQSPNYMTSSTTALNSTICNMRCSGAGDEICGGPNALSVYTNPSYVTPSAGSGPNYLGCATDNLQNSGRALNGPSTSSSSMTPAVCKAFCASSGPGYQFYATEYSSQCFCGNALRAPNYITNSSTAVSPSICNMRCSGDTTQLCGGPNALSLYTNPAYVPPTTNSPIGAYAAQGCLTDPGTHGRALQGAYLANNNMTEEACVAFCGSKAMPYAGIEYASQCFCGLAIAPGTNAQQVACDPTKLMVCAGNKTEYCGGPNLLTLYIASSV